MKISIILKRKAISKARESEPLFRLESTVPRQGADFIDMAFDDFIDLVII